MKQHRTLLTGPATSAAIFGIASSLCLAQPSATSISFQGVLNQPNGAPLANGSYELTFRFHTDAVGGTALATSTVPNVRVTNGLVSTAIPVDAAWFNGQALHLGVSVNGGPEPSPRVLVTAVPYAVKALSLASTFVGTNGYIGIGVTNPAYPLHVEGMTLVHGGSFIAGYGLGEREAALTVAQDSGIAHPNHTIFEAIGGAGLRKSFRIYTDNGEWDNLKCSLDGNLFIGGTTHTTVLQITSDQNAKQNFQPVDAREVLEKVAALPITRWSFTNAPKVRHMGPVAQDFAAAFGLGDSEKHISSVDADGVLFASVQALYQLVQEKDARINALEKELTELRSEFSTRLAAWERAIKQHVATFVRPGTSHETEEPTTTSHQ